MPCGLFGKLPMKRDFISVETPRGFLQIWEAWLQGGVAASRLALGHDWRDAFLRAPIWRFWLGPAICGFPVIGSFMSSVDGVGRFFPLTAIACGEAGDAFPPPTEDDQSDWFTDVERLLLATLEEGAAYETCLESLAALPMPARRPAAGADPTIRELFRARIATTADVEAIRDAFAALLLDRQNRLFDAGSFWWTIGGEDYPPAVLMSENMPDPNIVTSMLNGQFAPAQG